MGEIALVFIVSVWGDRKDLETQNSDGCTTV